MICGPATLAEAANPGLSPNAGTTFTVNTTADTVDADVGTAVCADLNGKCSLRAAILQANFTPGADTILLPAGTYTLTRPGDDDASILGDLDITDGLTIQGAGSAVTVIDANGGVTGDRAIQILSSAANVTLSGLTIRNGQKTANTFDEGGGLYWDGNASHLTLSNVVVQNNSARYGGGLYLNYSSLGDVVLLDHLTVHANTATTGAAGGLAVNFGDFAQFTLSNSQVDTNSGYEGAGLYFQQSTLSFGLTSVNIVNSAIFSNTGSLSAGFENHAGSASVPVVVQNSHFYNNTASFYGGAIGNYGALSIRSSTLETNSAIVRGGGIYDYEGGLLDLEQSTLNGNTSQTGGAIFSELFIHNSSNLELEDSTISANTASMDGAAIYAQGGQVNIFNTTIANNQVLVPASMTYTGMGGGVYISSPAVLSAENMILADNTHRYGAGAPVLDDCFGPLGSLGYNLIRTTTNCTLSGSTAGLITGVDPLLGPLQNNGGLTLTQMLKPTSPAINAGQSPLCLNAQGSPFATDQRGFQRDVGRCDIGAVEYFFGSFIPLVKK